MNPTPEKREVARKWPHDEPNGWNLDAVEFLNRVRSQPSLWLKFSQAKYLELRVDTRDCGFNLYDRDRNPISPDLVIEAIEKANADFGKNTSYRPETPLAIVCGERDQLVKALEVAFTAWDTSSDEDEHSAALTFIRMVRAALTSIQKDNGK